jgi:hypothetical protein
MECQKTNGINPRSAFRQQLQKHNSILWHPVPVTVQNCRILIRCLYPLYRSTNDHVNFHNPHTETEQQLTWHAKALFSVPNVRLGSRSRGYHPVARWPISCRPFVHHLSFHPSSPEALHLKLHERPLLVKDRIMGEKWPVNLTSSSR